MSLVTSIRSETLKAKRSSAFWLTVLGAGSLPFAFLLMYYFKEDEFAVIAKANPWPSHFKHGWEGMSAFLLPMFIILICSLITQIEYKNNCWKQVFASPQTLTEIFFSKFIAIHLLILFCFFAFNLFLIMSALGANLLDRRYTFFSYAIDWAVLLKMNFKSYISVMAISAIQYCLNLRFKNFIVPIAIGLALLVISLLFLNWEHIYKLPYAYTVLTYKFMPAKNHFLQNHEWNSIGYFAFFTLLAFLYIKYRKERG